jgi:hypothetical protein
MMLPLLIAALLGLSGIAIVVYPLLGLEPVRANTATEPVADVAEREQVAKRVLRDVDFDYRLGNLDEADYLALRDRYERRALAALKTRYEREQALDALIDEQLAALRSGKPAPGGGAGNGVSRAQTATKSSGTSSGARAAASPSAKSRANGHSPTVRRSTLRRGKRV